MVFYKLATALTNFENHRTTEAHERNLIAKLFVFYYIDCFLWFFLLGFFQIPFGHQIESVLQSTFNVTFDITYDRASWEGRLGFCIAAVLGLVQ